MIEALSQVNWLAVLAVSVANFLLGGIWFVGLVDRFYPITLGIADRPTQKDGALSLVGPFACGAVTIVASAVLLRALGITSYGEALGLGLGLLVGLGYLVPMTPHSRSSVHPCLGVLDRASAAIAPFLSSCS